MIRKTDSTLIFKNLNILKPSKRLIEFEDSSDDIKVYMNTWANYNGDKQGDAGHVDLDVYGIKDGWMTPEEGLEFCEKYAEDNPFINDTDNCPFEVSEYDSTVDKLNEMIRYNEFEDKELLKNAMETGMYSSIDDYIDVLESGDYIWFPGVSDDEDLGRAYVDMVGFDGVSNIEQYFDRDGFKEDIEADERSAYAENEGIDEDDIDEDDFQAYLDAIVDEEAENYDGTNEENFDYEALGRDLSFDYTYTSDGAIQLM